MLQTELFGGMELWKVFNTFLMINRAAGHECICIIQAVTCS